MLEKLEYYNKLFDIYKSLLTTKQQEYFLMYYSKDYSLFEIADYYGVSRNAVYDQINKTVKKLTDLEDKLNILKKEEFQRKALDLFLKTKDEKHILKIIKEMDDIDGI